MGRGMKKIFQMCMRMSANFANKIYICNSPTLRRQELLSHIPKKWLSSIYTLFATKPTSTLLKIHQIHFLDSPDTSPIS